METRHIAWDDGAVSSAIQEVTGVPAQFYQTTTKTRCGKRARLARVDNDSPTCPLCITDRDDELERFRKLEPLVRKLLGQCGEDRDG